MDQAKWNKIDAILDHALDSQNPEQQERVIREACNDNKKLYNRVSSLLRSIRQAKKSNFLEVE